MLSSRDPAIFVPAGHFYSPIPDPAEAQIAINKAKTTLSISSINCNDDVQLDFFRKISVAARACDFPDNASSTHRYYYHNDQFSYGDAIIYQAVLRHLRPSRLIEVGSGYSSAVALDTRDRHNVPGHMTFIEPHPDRLLSLLRTGDADRIEIKRSKVQSVDPAFFELLGANDVLFIDSSHVAKTGSDLCYLVFEVLPRLQPGVFVHFHDCFWPFEYPERWAVTELRSWNELYFVRAFLMFNNSFEIILFNDFIAKKYPEEIQRYAPLIAKNPGGGLWLRVQTKR